jgi:hypothetical protein
MHEAVEGLPREAMEALMTVFRALLERSRPTPQASKGRVLPRHSMLIGQAGAVPQLPAMPTRSRSSGSS